MISTIRFICGCSFTYENGKGIISANPCEKHVTPELLEAMIKAIKKGQGLK